MTYTKTYKPSDIYRQRPTVPTGYQVVDFRIPVPGETVIGLGLNMTYSLEPSDRFTSPRLIIEPISTTPDWWE